MINYFKIDRPIRYMIKFVILFILLIQVLTGCSSSNSSKDKNAAPYITKTALQLNTVVTINLYDKQDQKILDGCFDLIAKYENIYSTTINTTELYKLNHGTLPHNGLTYHISNELAGVLQYGLYYCKLSGGSFDISIGPASSLWDFIDPNPKVPPKQEIEAALPYIDYKNITLDGNDLTFTKEGIQIDLGAIAKGYIADRIKDYLLANGVKSAMINLGGNVLCVGGKPDGSPFRVGIQKPFADRNETVAIIEITDLSVVSSGIYERFFKQDGVLYHHILDPKTGFPVNNNLVAVTIISKVSADGDGLSTSCFALGLDKGMALIETIPDTYAAFITKDYQIHYTKGFQDAIKFAQ